MHKQIVNIVNFIRGCEPRSKTDLVEPVREQIKLMQEYGLPGTFLVQYDALLDPCITELLLALDPSQFELGVWHEIVQPEAEACGIPWTGRYPWDWHVHCGFPVGYTKAQREQLCDELFAKFRSVFGYYPRVFGSWFFDSHTIRYLCSKYSLDALCNCKEQYGTDGYTLWGGYYGHGYYPSCDNVFFPAQTQECQLPVPLFRMLGSDPVYQYDCGMSLQSGAPPRQSVITLEPVYTGMTGGGGRRDWTDWFLRENFNGDCLSFGYAQAGQENSFGWEAMRDGLTYQFARFADLRKSGLTVEPLGETGRQFKATYTATPASAITAHTSFDDPLKNSVWYSSKYYRINLYSDGSLLRIRDLHVFREHCPDPFEDTVCLSDEAQYETLPVTDGNRHTGNGILAGIRIENSRTGKPIPPGKMIFSQIGEGEAQVSYGNVTFTLRENRATVAAPIDFTLQFYADKTKNHMPTVLACDDRTLTLSYNGFPYIIRLNRGRFSDARTVESEEGSVEAVFSSI